jgi:hypothetical protein
LRICGGTARLPCPPGYDPVPLSSTGLPRAADGGSKVPWNRRTWPSWTTFRTGEARSTIGVPSSVVSHRGAAACCPASCPSWTGRRGRRSCRRVPFLLLERPLAAVVVLFVAATSDDMGLAFSVEPSSHSTYRLLLQLLLARSSNLARRSAPSWDALTCQATF